MKKVIGIYWPVSNGYPYSPSVRPSIARQYIYGTRNFQAFDEFLQRQYTYK